MISDLSIPSRQMELAERARRRGERLVREEDACGIPSSVDDETASNASETVSKVTGARPTSSHASGARVCVSTVYSMHVGIDIFVCDIYCDGSLVMCCKTVVKVLVQGAFVLL